VSHETNVEDVASLGTQRTATDDHLWMKCRGCGGEVGVPSNWGNPAVQCPSCKLTMQVQGEVLFRPPTHGIANFAAAPQSATLTNSQHSLLQSPSLELGRESDWAMVWGILSVVLGWTVLVPLFGLVGYGEASTLARKEGVPIPRRAIVGLILSLLFGTVQTIALVARLTDS
jgi:hypothetical protein